MSRRFNRPAEPPPEDEAWPDAATIERDDCEDIALVAMQGLLAAGHPPNTVAETAWREVVPAYIKARAAFPAFIIRLHGQPEPSEPEGDQTP